MTEIPENILDTKARPARRCRIAYTLNNDQPVRCTLLGEEPLFYMDHEGSFDDELEFEAAFNFDVIEKGIDNLKEKITALGRLDPYDQKPAAAIMEEYLDDLAFATQPRDAFSE